MLYLTKPKVYTVVARYLGYPSKDDMREAIPILERIDKVITADYEDEKILHGWGYKNTSTILPGISVSRFEYQAPSTTRFRVLMASAPWASRQLEKKGIRILIEAVREIPDIEVIFLWRGFCLEEMKELVTINSVEEKVKIVNKNVDILTYFKEIHTTIAPFTTYEESRAYPTSVIESLASGKPVLVSNQIPMASLIEEEECGIVIQPTKDGILLGIEKMRQRYRDLQKNCIPTARKYFSQKRLLDDYTSIYREVLNRGRK
jgi:glycosyltransferase involved in cell wall biosynthesis